MKAYVRIAAENQEVKLVEIPTPQIENDEVLVDIKAFGVGIHDRYFIPNDVKFPYVVGSEGAGVITKLGSDVKDFNIGDRVIFTSVLQPQGGTWAEAAAVNRNALIPLPENLTFQEGAAIPIAGSTALECMRALNLTNNENLFIAGASGAIGSFIIQMAAIEGANIATSASERNHKYMKSLGAVETVDYHDQNWKDQVKEWSGNGVDVALAIQPGTVKDSMEVVKDGGRVITVSGYDETKPERNISIKQFEHHQDKQTAMTQLVSDISSAKIKLNIEDTYSFEQTLSALAKTETRHARGKSVVIF